MPIYPLDPIDFDSIKDVDTALDLLQTNITLMTEMSENDFPSLVDRGILVANLDYLKTYYEKIEALLRTSK